MVPVAFSKRWWHHFVYLGLLLVLPVFCFLGDPEIENAGMGYFISVSILGLVSILYWTPYRVVVGPRELVLHYPLKRFRYLPEELQSVEIVETRDGPRIWLYSIYGGPISVGSMDSSPRIVCHAVQEFMSQYSDAELF